MNDGTKTAFAVVGAILYFVCPLDGDFIPIIGWIDDLIVAVIAGRYAMRDTSAKLAGRDDEEDDGDEEYEPRPRRRRAARPGGATGPPAPPPTAGRQARRGRRGGRGAALVTPARSDRCRATQSTTGLRAAVHGGRHAARRVPGARRPRTHRPCPATAGGRRGGRPGGAVLIVRGCFMVATIFYDALAGLGCASITVAMTVAVTVLLAVRLGFAPRAARLLARLLEGGKEG